MPKWVDLQLPTIRDNTIYSAVDYSNIKHNITENLHHNDHGVQRGGTNIGENRAVFELTVVTPSAKVVVFHINPLGGGDVSVLDAQNWQQVAWAEDGLAVPLEQNRQYTLLAVPVSGGTIAYNVDHWNFSGGISLIDYMGTRIGRENDISAATVQVTGNATASVNFNVKSSSPSYCDDVHGTNNWFVQVAFILRSENDANVHR